MSPIRFYAEMRLAVAALWQATRDALATWRARRVQLRQLERIFG